MVGKLHIRVLIKGSRDNGGGVASGLVEWSLRSVEDVQNRCLQQDKSLISPLRWE